MNSLPAGFTMNMLTDVRDISRIGYGFMASKVLFAALDLDLFTRLARQPLDVEALAAQAGVPPGRLQMLMTPLRSLGLVGVDAEGRHFNSPAAADFLAKGSPRYYGDYFRFQIDRQIYPYMTGLLPAMRGEPSPPFYEQMVDPGEARSFSVAQHAGSLGAAHLLARRLPTAGWRHVLDVAGGSGAFAITLCQRNAELKATILDYPAVCDVAAGYVSEAGLSERVGFVRGDARTTTWPDGVDAVLMSYLLSAVRHDEMSLLFEHAFAALAPGGSLVLHDFMVNDERDGPTSAALWMLLGLVSDPDAIQLTPGTVTALARAAGFTATQEFELLPTITRVVVARKPQGEGP